MTEPAVDPVVVDLFDDHQRRAIAALGRTLAAVQVGMSEVEIAQVARDKATEAGFDRWFHEPEVAINERTLTRGNRLSDSARLKHGDLLVIDIAPATDQAYGDIGTSIIFGSDDSDLLSVGREACRGACGYASQWKTIGEVYVYAKAWAVNHRYTLSSERAIGHRLVTKQSVGLAWPKGAHAATMLRRNQVHFLNPVRIRGLWAIRPQVSDGKVGVSFEEAVYIDGDTHRVLGRDSIDEIGTFPNE